MMIVRDTYIAVLKNGFYRKTEEGWRKSNAAYSRVKGTDNKTL